MYPKKFLKLLDIDTLRDLYTILDDSHAQHLVKREIVKRLGL